MSNAVLQASVLSINGGVTVGAGAMITVRTPAGALVSLYEDRDGLTPAGNPVYADPNGFFRVYAAAGRYNITATTGAGAQQYNDVAAAPDAYDSSNIAVTGGTIDGAAIGGVTPAAGAFSTLSVEDANGAKDSLRLQIDGAVELRTLAPVDGERAYLNYHTTEGDAGHGIFRGVTGAAPGTYVDDDDLVIIPTGGDGSAAWLRVFAGNSATIAIVTPATDADVTLTEAQYSADILVIETGAWSTNRNIIAPDESRKWDIFSTSVYTATVKTAAGTGIPVAAGTSKPLVCDGTNVVDPATALANAKLSGDVVQVVSTQTGAVATGTTVLPNDDSIPQNTEGDEYMTLPITPTSATNTLEIDIVCHVSHSSATPAVMNAAIFQDSTANAIAAGHSAKSSVVNGSAEITFRHTMTAGTASATTFKVRAGAGGAGTTTFNGIGGSRVFGGVMASSITIREIQA